MNTELDLNDPLLRAVLLEIGKRPAGHGYDPIQIEGRTHAEIELAIVKLASAGYIKAEFIPPTFGRRGDWQPSVLTERGRAALR